MIYVLHVENWLYGLQVRSADWKSIWSYIGWWHISNSTMRIDYHFWLLASATEWSAWWYFFFISFLFIVLRKSVENCELRCEKLGRSEMELKKKIIKKSHFITVCVRYAIVHTIFQYERQLNKNAKQHCILYV